MSYKANAIAASFFQNYLNKAEDKELNKALKANLKSVEKFLCKIPANKRTYAYAEGKWTIKQLLQHMIDTERVFAYRALRFARKDATPLPGFDENAWASNATAATRKWNSLVNEFIAVRKTTLALFEALDKKELLLEGIASNNVVNVLALGYIIAGHANHHIDIINERYLPKKK
ncbi:MAG: DinB family protein [Sphingobacteriales bacterium]|jgi:hypothetical protein|nr:MAG: DinB family protein [Sphingobacteriales bacterium]